MFEIPFISKDILGADSKKQAQLQTARMVELVACADKLAKADWPIEWTITGVAFDLPREIKHVPGIAWTPAAVRQKLLAMGISDDFRSQSSRSLLDIVVAKSEYTDRARYNEAHADIRYFLRCDFPSWEHERFIRRDIEKMADIEDRYNRSDLLVDGDYQCGTILGRHEALEWLFGEEWPALKAPDELEEEDMEEERCFARSEQAIEDVHALLFKGQETRETGSAQPDSTPAAQAGALNLTPDEMTADPNGTAAVIARIKKREQAAIQH
jgi:hypothetical protein